VRARCDAPDSPEQSSDGRRSRTRRARIKLQGRVTALSATGSAGISAVNAAIEVGKHKLDIALGSAASYGRQTRAGMTETAVATTYIDT
jgi:hypothetical protein